MTMLMKSLELVFSLFRASDELCEEDALRRIQTLHLKFDDLPRCLEGNCVKINGYKQCRSPDSHGAMIVSASHAEKLRKRNVEKYGILVDLESGASSTFSSVVVWTKCVTFSIALFVTNSCARSFLS